MKVNILLSGGHNAVAETDDAYGLKSALLSDSSGYSNYQHHVVGQDGSDIYFRHQDVIAVGIPPK